MKKIIQYALCLSLMAGSYVVPSSAVSFRYHSRNIFDQFEDMFKDLYHMTRGQFDDYAITRKVNMKHSENQTKITVELPGFSEKDIEIKIHEESGNKYLVINAKKEIEKTEQQETKSGGKTKSHESSYEHFHRKMLLDPQHNDEKINADFKNGLLTVTIPLDKKVEEKKAKTIKINTNK